MQCCAHVSFHYFIWSLGLFLSVATNHVKKAPRSSQFHTILHPSRSFIGMPVFVVKTSCLHYIYIHLINYKLISTSAWEIMERFKVQHGRSSSAVVVPKTRPGLTRYASILAVLVMFLALPHECNAQSDDCDSCEVGTYAAVKGSEICSPCGGGTFGASPGSSTCTDCGAGIFPEGVDYMGVCGVEQTKFQVQGNNLVTGTMYRGPGNTAWFHVAVESISLRAILDSVSMDWGVGTQVRLGSALGQSRILNPVVLRRIGTSEQGLWSPANVDPMHTRNSTRYYVFAQSR